MVRDMDIAAFDPRDGRRLEIVVDGLLLFGGAQCAVDTTLVSALCCGQGTSTGRHSFELADARRGPIPNWSVVKHGLGWSGEVAGRWSEETR